METAGTHPFYLVNSRTGRQQGFSTRDSAREALLSWILLQRQGGETVVEQETGQWSDSRITMWVADQAGTVVRLEGENGV